jgi:hypothetical protein
MLGDAVALALIEELAEEPLGSLLPSPVHENIEDMTVLIDRTPEKLALPIDREEHLIHVPRLPWSRTPTVQLISILLSELPDPISHGFIGQDDAACGHQDFNVTVAEAEEK